MGILNSIGQMPPVQPIQFIPPPNTMAPPPQPQMQQGQPGQGQGGGIMDQLFRLFGVGGGKGGNQGDIMALLSLIGG